MSNCTQQGQMESSHSSDGSIPETPWRESPDRPMMSPPGMQFQQVQQEEIGVMPSHVNIDTNHDGDGDSNDNNIFIARTAALLDFPVMRHHRPILGQSSTTTFSRLSYNLSLNRETVRRGRRRTSSFDDIVPVPRIALKPRFSRLTDSNRYQPIDLSPIRHQLSSDSCSCMECIAASVAALPNPVNSSGNQIPVEWLRPRRATHFRHHTYGGSDASTEIFAAAMELEMEENSDSRISSSEHEATVPIIHNSFEFSQLHQNLPPAAQTFIAPRDTASSSRDINRPIPRRHRKRTAEISFPCPPTSCQVGRQPSASITTQSFGTPTCTTTCSSDVSAFDQTSPHHWQDQSPGNCSTIFQGLKSLDSRDEDDHKFKSEGTDGGEESSLPFDEVHLLMDQGDVDIEDKSRKQA